MGFSVPRPYFSVLYDEYACEGTNCHIAFPQNEFLGIWPTNKLGLCFAIRSTGVALVPYSDLGRSRSRSSRNPAAQAAGLSETMQQLFQYCNAEVSIHTFSVMHLNAHGATSLVAFSSN